MHISLDGYVTAEQVAANFVWDADVIKFCVDNLKNVVDEFYFLVSPVCFSKGLTIFQSINEVLPLRLIKSHSFDCGNVLLNYKSNK